MEGDGNFQNFSKVEDAHKLKWAEKNRKFGNCARLQLERGEQINTSSSYFSLCTINNQLLFLQSLLHFKVTVWILMEITILECQQLLQA